MEFPIASVSVDVTENIICNDDFRSPIFSCPHFKINEKDFLLNIEKIAFYRVRDGEKVSVQFHENSDIASVKLFLHGSVLGALLHQKGILPFHGSSFVYNGKGVIVCGYSGAGKSSVVMAFCQKGAELVSDDISPVKIEDDRTLILPVKIQLKLWKDSITKLNINDEGLENIRPNMNKYYLPSVNVSSKERQLDHIIILNNHNNPEFLVNELAGLSKYNALLRHIYRKVYLKGMPETERKYFRQLFQLAGKVRVTKITRPRVCNIYDTMEHIRKVISQ